MTISRSIFDSTRFICVLLGIGHLAYMKMQRENLMLSGVEEGDNLMLTRLTPVATLVLPHVTR